MLKSSLFSGHPGISHGFFTRKGGTSSGIFASMNLGLGSGDTPNDVKENRKRAASAFDLPEDRLLTLYQTHSSTALIIDAPFLADARPKGDALVTKTPGLMLGALSADCVPVLLHDPIAGVIAAAHAGWRGALGGILESTLDAMIRLGASSKTIIAAIGPAIEQNSYEVGYDLYADVIHQDIVNTRFFRPQLENARLENAKIKSYGFTEKASLSEDKWMFDVKGYVAHRLHQAGIRQIDCLPHDTYRQEDLFFSYRRATHRGESDYGRGLSAICIKE